MKCHLIEGAPGCAYAVANEYVAIIVDALRASATAAMLLDAGATEILVLKEVEEALAAKAHWPDALLYGERGGLPPHGFDFGNSPREAAAAKGRRVIFTTTTGAGRLIDCHGAHAIYMGTTVNAAAAARAAASHGRNVVLIPAGLATDPAFDAQEDWVAAAIVADRLGLPIGEGAARFDHWRKRIAQEGAAAVFQAAPHAEKLYRIGLEADIAYCAQVDITDAAPRVSGAYRSGVILRRARRFAIIFN